MKHAQSERHRIFAGKKVHWKEHVLLGLGHNNCAAKDLLFVIKNRTEKNAIFIGI
jgi:hypothetical protein